jgi:hypothetical protein
MPRVETIDEVARFIVDLLRSDRDVTAAVGGMTGEGKSTFEWHLAVAVARQLKAKFSMNNFTWSRRELLRWIDGEGKEHKGRLPEYSVIVPDELIFMFYKRRWFDDEQIEGVETFNTCRDRHLFVIGSCPSFWSLDSAFTSRVRYYIYIPKRGVAWVFQQENNPFVINAWNASLNMKWFRRQGNPYGLPNFVCEVLFRDWTPGEKAAYYEVRNRKRVTAKDEAHEGRDKHRDIKQQRDKAFRLAFKYCGHRKKGGEGMSIPEFADYFNMSEEMMRVILEGVSARFGKKREDEA